MKYIFLSISSFLLLAAFKSDKTYYIDFDIPGKQMAITLPPWGIFIEKEYGHDKILLKHEKVHWQQYRRMGFWGFYSTYISDYLKYGRKNSPMEVEARKLSRKRR